MKPIALYNQQGDMMLVSPEKAEKHIANGWSVDEPIKKSQSKKKADKVATETEEV